MRTLIAVIALLGVTISSATACNQAMFTVLDWRVTENPGNRFLPYRLEVDTTYVGQRPYRMIHAGVILSDALGQSVGQVNMERDQHVKPGDNVLVDGQVDVDERLAKINRDDVVSRTCVWSIVYDDGTVEKF